MKYSHSTTGYSLIEVLVAVSILMLSIVGPITIAMKSLQSAQYARQQNTAFFLAQEGISAVNTLRNDAALASFISSSDPWEWVTNPAIDSCFDASGCGIDFRDSSLLSNVVDCSSSEAACTLRYDSTPTRASYQYAEGDATVYTRVITLENVGPAEVLVTSKVHWDSQLLDQTQQVVLTTSLFNLYGQ